MQYARGYARRAHIYGGTKVSIACANYSIVLYSVRQVVQHRDKILCYCAFMHSNLYQEPTRSARVVEQYHSTVGKYLATVPEATSLTASFTLQHLDTYVAVLEQANLRPLGISKHLGGLATFGACLKIADLPNVAM